MGKQGREVAPGIARVIGLVFVPGGFSLMILGVTTYVGHLDAPDADGRSGLVRFGVGALVLGLGMVWLDRGFGRGARSLGPLVPLRIERLPIAHPDATRLVEEVQEEYVARYGGRDDTPLEPTAFDPPRGAFFIGYDGDRPVASGAWRLREDVEAFGTTRAGEIKRMYVVPSAQRRGHGRRMLEHLETTLGQAGAEVAILETGRMQPEAMALYESAGYKNIEKFGHYRDAPESVCYAKLL